ncbi:hypothetical protein HY439_02905 [Candidatus Microgenomates bacterium]|nr:hypothetical protein [Candidatus Microgenomates bacterium]
MKTKIKIGLGAISGTAALLTSAGIAFAQPILNAPPGFGNLQNINFNSAIPGIIRLLLVVAFIVAFVFLIIGGIRWILSGGDKAAAESARGTLTAAVIGLIIVLAAWLIISVIEQLFGISIISSTNVVIPGLYQ